MKTTNAVWIALVGLLIAGCAGKLGELAIEEARYERLDSEAALVAEFNNRVERCRFSGGYMVLPMGGGGRIDRSTMKKAYCDKDWQGLKGVLYE